MWPEEATAVLESGRSLTELRSIGPFTVHFIAQWSCFSRSASPPPSSPAFREIEFLTSFRA
jgi:hypothetical protein